eukprot:jgi/Ulvmu1/4289/UM002_0009.1
MQPLVGSCAKRCLVYVVQIRPGFATATRHQQLLASQSAACQLCECLTASLRSNIFIPPDLLQAKQPQQEALQGPPDHLRLFKQPEHAAGPLASPALAKGHAPHCRRPEQHLCLRVLSSSTGPAAKACDAGATSESMRAAIQVTVQCIAETTKVPPRSPTEFHLRPPPDVRQAILSGGAVSSSGRHRRAISPRPAVPTARASSSFSTLPPRASSSPSRRPSTPWQPNKAVLIYLSAGSRPPTASSPSHESAPPVSPRQQPNAALAWTLAAVTLADTRIMLLAPVLHRNPAGMGAAGLGDRA